ncbi:MAG: AMIN domain-containing protein [Chromatiales bacterium]|nr:AMIN domain-containing protein [Chromatiales bacterium]
MFTTSSPARIALDFPGTDVKMAVSSVKIGEGAVLGVNAVQGKDRSRVVVNLVRAAGYTTTSDARSFTITVDNPVGGIAGTQAPKTTRFASAPRPGKHSLKGIDFRRGPQGDGKIVIGLSDTGVGIDIREQAGEIIVDFLDTSIPAELQRRLDVTDFGTPVTQHRHLRAGQEHPAGHRRQGQVRASGLPGRRRVHRQREADYREAGRGQEGRVRLLR